MDGVMWVGRAVVFTVGLAAILALLLALAFVTLGRRLGAPAHTPTVHSGPRGYTHEPDPVPDSSFPFPHHPQGHRASPRPSVASRGGESFIIPLPNVCLTVTRRFSPAGKLRF